MGEGQRERERERERPAEQGLETNRHCGRGRVRADPHVQMAKAKAQSKAIWSGTELVYAVVQPGKTPNCVVMTMRL